MTHAAVDFDRQSLCGQPLTPAVDASRHSRRGTCPQCVAAMQATRDYLGLPPLTPPPPPPPPPPR